MTESAAALPIRITPETLLREMQQVSEKLTRGSQRLSAYTEDQLAIATTPKDEVWRQDMVRLYRYRPTVEKPARVPVLLAYALVGRYQMIDLEPDRSFVRKLLAEGLDVYVIDWGLPTRAQRWLTIDDYVSGYLDDCVDLIRERHGVDKINLLGVCQGGVFATCYAALFPQKIRNLVLTVTPLDFHGDMDHPEPGAGYMNLWARSLKPEDIDMMVDTMGTAPGAMVGFSFLMMNPVGNVTKYTTELVDMLDDESKMLGFLRMERWIADRPGHPGEVMRQWFKDLYQANKLVKSELMLGDRRVDLDQIRMPVLNVYATGDVIIPVSCSQGMEDRFGTDDYSELSVPGGHIGTFVGGKAQKVLAPSIAKWLRERN
ncbi:class III poly(R)-hydroxyalkanoic acid synthase subunit PhaC [Variovorax sp. J22R24]|uniref:class III poly(R)-hydroxyalkanoic acid synthase subunit PhaC n=1 Tax=Variovorax gracilis TaxID=3053502 RepID=UPI002578437F|nr:class III poly(R)-hydroxyalkanoic acid synthase subunit PhaC [Variovorax sp. J22R24]MDM0109771.1 class III poly(R)-hydroxyalkanoic acid synthase subunit PhaC [Variovorax sp. J22R24]